MTINNLDDYLSPALLEKAKPFANKKHLDDIEEYEPGSWSALFKNDGKEYFLGIDLSKKGAVNLVSCECSPGKEEKLTETPCLHAAALLLFLGKDKPFEKNEKPYPGEKTAKNKKAKADEALKKIAKTRAKDPAEQLLGELDPKEIFDFMKQMISKNKEFKTQFLVHFSEKSGENEQKFEEIVQQSIKSVRGRKKYLKGADAAKIASQLTPIYKQAATAESKGLFREAVAICLAFLKNAPAVLESLETPSSKMEQLFLKVCELFEVVLKNPALPFDFRDEIFESAKKVYQDHEMAAPGNEIGQYLFKAWHEAAKAAKKESEMQETMFQLVGFHEKRAKASHYHWSAENMAFMSIAVRTVDFFDKTLNRLDLSIDLLKKHERKAELAKLLVKKLIQAGRIEESQKLVEEMKTMPKKFEGHSSIGLGYTNEMLFEIAKSTGNLQLMLETAEQSFKESNYENFEFFNILKVKTPPEKWPEKVENLLEATARMRFFMFNSLNPYFEILLREGRKEEIWKHLLETSNGQVWAKYAPEVAHFEPVKFLEESKKRINRLVLENFNSHIYTITELINAMKKTSPEGMAEAKIVIENLKQKHSRNHWIRTALEKIDR